MHDFILYVKLFYEKLLNFLKVSKLCIIMENNLGIVFFITKCQFLRITLLMSKPFETVMALNQFQEHML
jgi:hypothetical protein